MYAFMALSVASVDNKHFSEAKAYSVWEKTSLKNSVTKI